MPINTAYLRIALKWRVRELRKERHNFFFFKWKKNEPLMIIKPYRYHGRILLHIYVNINVKKQNNGIQIASYRQQPWTDPWSRISSSTGPLFISTLRTLLVSSTAMSRKSLSTLSESLAEVSKQRMLWDSAQLFPSSIVISRSLWRSSLFPVRGKKMTCWLHSGSTGLLYMLEDMFVRTYQLYFNVGERMLIREA